MRHAILASVLMAGGGALGLCNCCRQDVAPSDDAGPTCAWRGLDAGACMSDSDCASGDYCDGFVKNECTIPAASPILVRSVVGTCLPICDGQRCSVDENCYPDEGCFDGIDSQQRCDGGVGCVCTSGGSAPVQPECNLGCSLTSLPHLRGYLCVCSLTLCGDAGQQ